MDALNDRDKVVHVAAMFGLYRLGDTKSLELLEQSAADPDEEVRQWAIRELGFVGASRSVPVLSVALKDSSLSVRVTRQRMPGKDCFPRIAGYPDRGIAGPRGEHPCGCG